MKNKNVILVNDLPGKGKVALAAMTPLLSYMGYGVLNLPTALVSNTLDYGKFHIQDATDYMDETLRVWEDLGFEAQALATGFITNPRQVPIIEEYIQAHREGLYVMVDPIMGDHGSLYHGLSSDLIPLMKRLIAQADLTIPNCTEAFLLNGGDGSEVLSHKKDILQLGENLLSLGAKSYLITSVFYQGLYWVFGYDHKKKKDFSFSYNKLPVNYPGTGDVFSAILLGRLLDGHDLEDAAMEASRFIYQAIIDSQSYTKDTREGLLVERHFHLLES